MGWAIYSGVLTAGEVSEVHSIKTDSQKQRDTRILKNKYRVVTVGNKLVLTDLNYEKPDILRVYGLSSNNPYYDEIIKEEIYGAEQTNYDEAPSFINALFGAEGSVTVHAYENRVDYSEYSAEYERSKGSESGRSILSDSALQDGTGDIESDRTDAVKYLFFWRKVLTGPQTAKDTAQSRAMIGSVFEQFRQTAYNK